MKVVGIIPVRLASTRLPQKALRKICDIPMILHTYKRAAMCNVLEDLIVATDSEEIANLITLNGGKVAMTSSKHATGSDRIAEVASNLKADIVVNIQGDEAILDPNDISASIEALVSSKRAVASILVREFTKKNSPSDIKVALNLNNEVMYMSRSDIPFYRLATEEVFFKAYHLVSYRRDFLLTYTKLKMTRLEEIESNEYLRILENAYIIQAKLVNSSSISVDTQEDLDMVEIMMKDDPLFENYKGKVVLKK